MRLAPNARCIAAIGHQPNGQAFSISCSTTGGPNVDSLPTPPAQPPSRAFKGQPQRLRLIPWLFTTTVSTALTTGGKSLSSLPFILGDYNHNGIVDAPDYDVWPQHVR